MIDELTKTFFDTFGIEPYVEIGMVDYPTITDRILLELICIMTNILSEMTCCYMTVAEDVEQLKIDILKDCIDYSEHIKHQVRTLFKEER